MALETLQYAANLRVPITLGPLSQQEKGLFLTLSKTLQSPRPEESPDTGGVRKAAKDLRQQAAQAAKASPRVLWVEVP